METLLNNLFETLPFLESFGPGVIIPLVCFAIVGILAQWSLYDKCGLPGIDCVIPVKNVTTFLKIVGRPASHSLMVIIPPPLILATFMVVENSALAFTITSVIGAVWAVFMIKVYIELCQSFGHYKWYDYLMVVLFNGFYVLHLGLSYSETYKGPVYGKKKNTEEKEKLEGQLV